MLISSFATNLRHTQYSTLPCLLLYKGLLIYNITYRDMHIHIWYVYQYVCNKINIVTYMYICRKVYVWAFAATFALLKCHFLLFRHLHHSPPTVCSSNQQQWLITLDIPQHSQVSFPIVVSICYNMYYCIYTTMIVVAAPALSRC